jgi:hypothetical protein
MRILILTLTSLAIARADGVIAHLAVGEGWTTTITVVNTGTSAEPVTVWFWANDGSALTLNVTGLGAYPSATWQLLPNGMGVATVTGDPNRMQQGYATVVGRTVGGNAILRWQLAEYLDYKASVPITPTVQKLVFPFDNTSGYYTGIALTNTNTNTSFVQMSIRDSYGNVISTTHVTNVNHQALLLKDLYPETSGIAGTIEFVAFSFADGAPPVATISAIVLRFNPTGPFTPLTPAYAGNF